MVEVLNFNAKAYQKEMLPSDKMSDEEYAKEDMSNMEFLADAYVSNGGGTGKTFIWVNNLINQMIDEIKRDPRTYGKMPKELLYHGTINERNYLKKKLSELDPVDMRNKIERIMTKPVENPYSKVTYNEMKAFELFIDLSRNFQANKYEKSDMRTYFEFQDKIYKGHREIRNLDKKRESFNGNVPPEFEKEYQQKLADIVIKAPQIFFELPSDIRENYSPDNHFYQRLDEKSVEIKEILKEIDKKTTIKEEISHDDKLFIEMTNEIKKHEVKMRELVASGQFQENIDPRAQEFAYYEEDEYDNQYDFSQYNPFDSQEANSIELQSLVNEMNSEEIAFYGDDLNSLIYELQMKEKLEEDHTKQPLNNQKEEQFINHHSKQHLLSHYEEEIKILKELNSKWNYFSEQDELSLKLSHYLNDIEKQMATIVAKEQYLYNFVLKIIADPDQKTSAFYDKLSELIDKQNITNLEIESDLMIYMSNKKR